LTPGWHGPTTADFHHDVRGESSALVDKFRATLDHERLPVALKLAALPERIRGFGHVKERNMAAVATQRAALVANYRVPESLAATA
jgi:indolepyruvate ferredoxin oxidoreductase